MAFALFSMYECPDHSLIQ